MKFLIDAQLPRRMVGWLGSAGCDAVHTLDLPDGNRTTDTQVIACADQEQGVVAREKARVPLFLLFISFVSFAKIRVPFSSAVPPPQVSSGLVHWA
jgi:hypothetical protein